MKTNPSSILDRMCFRTVCATRLLPLLLLLALPAGLQAQFSYGTNDDGTITITGYTGPPWVVTIPDTISGLPVTSIGDWAFLLCTNLTSVTIGNSVTSIDWAAFGWCTSLANLTIGTNVTTIASAAFVRCTSLTNVVIADSVTSLGGAWWPPWVGGYSYDGAFGGCTSLTGVTIPMSLTNIGNGAFRACTSLKTITVDALNPVYSSVDGVLFDKNQTTLIQFPGGKAGSYTIPMSVTNIGDGVFWGGGAVGRSRAAPA